jgi:hypothetical protein
VKESKEGRKFRPAFPEGIGGPPPLHRAAARHGPVNQCLIKSRLVLEVMHNVGLVTRAALTISWTDAPAYPASANRFKAAPRICCRVAPFVSMKLPNGRYWLLLRQMDLWKREKGDDPRVQRITANLLRRMIQAKL